MGLLKLVVSGEFFNVRKKGTSWRKQFLEGIARVTMALFNSRGSLAGRRGPARSRFFVSQAWALV